MNSESTNNPPESDNGREDTLSSNRAQSIEASWRDPQVRERRQVAMRASSKDPQTVERRSNGQREKWRLARERLTTCFVCGRGPENDGDEVSR
jgi:hypothetical protein